LGSADTIPKAQLAEIVGLVEAQGDRVVGELCHTLVNPDPRTLIRKGVAARIADAARESGADMLVIDAELTPSQARNLEDATGFAVCDREAVILNVFERNATTRRARMQVEIAHLEYLRPRIRGIGLNMDQQMGGLNKARGPGETASELLARRLDGRIAQLKSSLGTLKTADSMTRKHRAGTRRIALVGYTNAGKTSLMNALTQAELSARARPFETLETTSRSLSRHGGDVLISDTVGFIRRLPARLYASFESTLAETAEASLLGIVVDSSDPEFQLHLETTHAVLNKLGAGDIPKFYVFNKADQLEEPLSDAVLRGVARGAPYRALSAHDAAAVSELSYALLDEARKDQLTEKVFVPYANTTATGRIYAQCRVLAADAMDDGVAYTIEGEAHLVRQLVMDLALGESPSNTAAERFEKEQA
jgi:GTP-binding protein HflX